MLVTIPEVLNKEDISVIQDLMATANFHEGSSSAGSEAKRVKNNHEMFISEVETQRLRQEYEDQLREQDRSGPDPAESRVNIEEL